MNFPNKIGIFGLPMSIGMMTVPRVSLAEGTGVSFNEGLSWAQIKATARKENLPIFVEIYTTWFGPCKMMEKDIYPNPKVDDYFNTHFISVKLKMDRTDQDSVQTRSWYKDADAIAREFGVPSYPTYFFFSPAGKLIYRDGGYKGAADFLALAKTSLTPRVVLPDQEYYAWVRNYQQGKKDYKMMPRMAGIARRLCQPEFIASIGKDYLKYLQGLKEAALYTRANIEFIASFIGKSDIPSASQDDSITEGSKSPFFHLFYPDGTRVDSVMSEKGYARHVVNEIIAREEPVPFARTNSANTGARCGGPAVERAEPDWLRLKKAIEDKYPGDYANRLVMIARVEWFSDQNRWADAVTWFTRLAKTYPMVAHDEREILFIIFYAYAAIFQRSVDKGAIDAAIGYTQNLLKSADEMHVAPMTFLDTYANLLYKADRQAEAIQWEEKALQAAKEWKQTDLNNYMDPIEQMKKNEPTWPHYLGD